MIGLFVAFAAMPYARRWQAREAVIASGADRAHRLRALIASETDLRDSAVQKAATLETGPQRLLSGRTAAVAAAGLQSALQNYGDQSQVTISQLDVAGAPDTTASTLPMIPATISAVGDVYGITGLLKLIQHGPLSLEIVDLAVRPNPALKGDLLQTTIALRAAYASGAEREVASIELPMPNIAQAETDAIVRANIFSSSRKPPRTRYRPFAAETEAIDASLAETIPDAQPDADAVPQLSGIMMGPRGASALLRLDPAATSAQIYREGDRGGVYRVLKINEQSVVLSGPAGRIELRLRRPES